MGVLGGKDIFSSKWITAEIVDSGRRIHYVPIKIVFGDYFLTKINKQLYVFKIDGTRIVTWRQTLVRSFRILQYDISHYMPISGPDYAELEQCLIENSLPKVDDFLHKTFKFLGKREKTEEFEPHDIESLIAEVSEQDDEYSEQIQNVISYLRQLKTKQIVTPVKRLADFLETDLKVTDPHFLGTIVSSYEAMEFQNKKVTNSPETGKKPWMKIIALLACVGIVIGLIFFIVSSGAISIPGITSSFKAPTADQLLGKYDTPESLKAAVDRGEVKYGDLPAQFKKMVDAVKLPTVTPQQHSVEIGATP